MCITVDTFSCFQKMAGKDSKTIERANLMNVSKLLIKELIDSSLAHGRMLDDDNVPMQQFFVVLEHVLRHGLKGTSAYKDYFVGRVHKHI